LACASGGVGVMRKKAVCPLVAFVLAASLSVAAAERDSSRIDRRALVSRHDPRVEAVDPTSPLSVGNGQFAFGVDVTGLQSLGELYYAEGIPLETLARWAWHSDPNPAGYTLADTGTCRHLAGATTQRTPSLSLGMAIWFLNP
jgi:hypothetical protein